MAKVHEKLKWISRDSFVGNINEVILMLERLRDAFPDYHISLRREIGDVDYVDEGFEVYGEREETKQEKEKRLKKKQKMKEAQKRRREREAKEKEKRERKEYEKLKVKFEGK